MVGAAAVGSVPSSGLWRTGSSKPIPTGNGPEEKRGSLGRANAAKFVERLCKYPGDSRVIAEAQQHILEAHAERLSAERGERRHC